MSTVTKESAEEIAHWVTDARERTLILVHDLLDDQLMGPRLAIVNPLRWEIGHVAWFQEKWVLRHAAGLPPVRPEVDALYDSMAIPHDTRWDLPLLSRASTLAYLQEVRERVLDQLRKRDPSPEEVYFNRLAVFHEDMHTEAFTYTRQTLEYPAPGAVSAEGLAFSDRPGVQRSPPLTQPAPLPDGSLPGDVQVAGGSFELGATPEEPFVFDNEKWVHEVEVAPFAIARAPVTQAEFAWFVEDGGYTRRELWSEEGWRWREAEGAERPVYWQRGPAGWERREFERWVPLEAHRPVLHVNWHEVCAYCRWAGRRLPTEAEWEKAASWDPATGRKRRFPWGDEPPTPERANLDWRGMGCADVAALADGDSAVGCRQMIGNVWEWTSSDFVPYPGFVVDPYKEYSEPWFYTHKVLRGGCWATRSRLIRNTWRNFHRPERRDVWAGFRTCAGC